MSQTSVTVLNRSQAQPHLRSPVIVRVAVASKSASRRHAARRAVLFGIAGVILAHISLGVALETVFPQVRDPEYGYRLIRLREQQRQHPDRPLVLVLGTSRTQDGITPQAMDFPDKPGSPLVFNFGQAGSHPLHQRLSLQRLLADGVRPAAVVIEICPPTLTMPGPADGLFAPYVSRLVAGDLLRLDPYLKNSAALGGRWAVNRVNPWHSQRLVIISHLVPQWLSWRQRVDFQWVATDQLGFTPYPMNEIEEHRKARSEHAFLEHGAALQHWQVSALAARAYHDLVADCREHGIAVSFFFMPESPLYRSWYAPESRRALDVYARRLVDEEKCSVFAAPTDYGEDAFADGHHMLPDAAVRYSRWLAKAHLRPWLTQVFKERAELSP